MRTRTTPDPTFRPRTALCGLLLLCAALLVPAGPVAAADAAPTSPPVEAPDRTPIVMVFGSDYPPFYVSRNEDPGTLKGLFMDFLHAFERAHPEFQIQPVLLPRRRMDLWMRDDRAQAFSLNSPDFVDPADRPLLRFTDPLWVTGDHLVVLSQRAAEFPTEASLHGHRVGLILGYGYGKYDKTIEQRLVDPVLLPNAVSQLRLLLTGRVDAIVANRHVLPCFLPDAGMTAADVAFIQPPLYEFGLRIEVRREQTELFDALQEFIARARKTGLLPPPVPSGPAPSATP